MSFLPSSIAKFLSRVKKIQKCDDLRGSLVRAEQACECCTGSSLRGAALVGQLILSTITEAIIAGQLGGVGQDTDDVGLQVVPSAGFVASVPTPGRIVFPDVGGGRPAVVRLPRGAPAPAGTILLLLGEVAFTVSRDLAALTAYQTLAEAVPRIVSAASKTARAGCLECMADKMLRQDRKRVSGRYSYSKRGGRSKTRSDEEPVTETTKDNDEDQP